MKTSANTISLILFIAPLQLFVFSNDSLTPESANAIIRNTACIDDDFGDCCDEPFDVWFDYDGDGLGNPDSSAVACLEYENWVINDDDPDDECFSNIIDCNGACDGSWVLDNFGECCEETHTVWQDLDGDGWGNSSISVEACNTYAGWVNNYMDKNDSLYCQTNIYDVCGVCDGNASTCTGCTDQTAINYEPENIIDDGSCIYGSEHIWHVAVSGSDESGTGTAENPFETIQHTIGVAQELDTILVHSGTYYENINFNGENLFLTSMFTFTGDTSYLHQTIIDGNQNGSVVTFDNYENNSAIISGFTITHGRGNIGGNLNVPRGGGIHCEYSQPTLKNLIITDNSGYYGGGIFCRYANPVIGDLQITENLANGGYSAEGAGIFLIHSSPTIRNTIVANNTSLQEDGGGIVMNAYSSPLLQNVEIIDNWAYSRGGGLFCWNHSSPVLENVAIIGNTTMTHAGGVHLDNHSDPTFRNSIIAGNSTMTDGGGIYIYDDSSPLLINTTIVNNTAAGEGGGLFLRSGGGPVTVNSIIWGNSPEQIHLSNYSTVQIAYSDVMGGEAGINSWVGEVIWGEGNLDSDPLLTDPASGNFSLQWESPCIDAGTDFYQIDETLILDYSTDEYNGAAPDMGAIESTLPGLIGDLNHDNSLTILDLIILVNYILDGIPPGDAFLLSDLNQDGEINILDIILLINLILGGRLDTTLSPTFARLILNDDLLEIRSDGQIAGGQLKVEGDFQIMEVLLPEEWEFRCEAGIMLFFCPGGLSLQNQMIISYSGDLRIVEATITDWNAISIPVIIPDFLTGFTINAAYPNPFNPVTTIEYQLAKEAQVVISIYNLEGQKLETLVKTRQKKNTYSVIWDAGNFASGVYLVSINIDSHSETQKLILLK